MLVELDKKGLIALVKGIDPSYDHMEIPIIKQNGSFSGSYGGWDWNYSAFENLSEEEIWAVYRLLKTPASRLYKQSLTETIVYSLKMLKGVEQARIEDHGHGKITIHVKGGEKDFIIDYLNTVIPITVHYEFRHNAE